MNSSKIKNILIDCDGVLTDGKVYYDAKGNRIKGFHSRDIRAIRQLISHGYYVCIVTQSTWPGIKDFSDRCGCDVLMSRDKSREAILPQLIGEQEYIMVGDDTSDCELLIGATLRFCPANADTFLKSAVPNINVLPEDGGDGVIADLVNKLELLK